MNQYVRAQWFGCELLAGIIIYVSSAYLQSKFPEVMAFKSPDAVGRAP